VIIVPANGLHTSSFGRRFWSALGADVGVRSLLVTVPKAKQGTFCGIMRRRALHKSDLPLRLAINPDPNERFRYAILCNDGMVAFASPATFATEAAARAAGGPVLRRRSLAAKLATLSMQQA
jgi:hypothetical protein